MTSEFAVPPGAVLGNRYLIGEILGSGGMGTVYRAHDRLTGRTVALKSVFTNVAPQTLITPRQIEASTLALAREFQMMATLRHPNIVSVLDYSFDGSGQPFLIMELLQPAETILEYGQKQPLAVKVQLLAQTLQALIYLHRRGIVHRDLKPSNLLIHEDRVRVLDFGLSVNMGEETAIGGTLAYIAPEFLDGQAATELSDLYAFGMIAYELLAGQHPFDLSDSSVLIDCIMYIHPDTEPLTAAGVPPQLSAVIARLLRKRPQERYFSAQDALAAFQAAVPYLAFTETMNTRESFLQAARFVGREKELGELTEALDDLCNGQGSAWLIGGESGVGKSRLLDELRTLSLVRGVQVIRCQALSERARPYQVWADAVRVICLSITPELFEASILKSIVPDIGQLLGRDVPDPEEVPPKMMQDLLLNVISSLLRREMNPTMFILDDAQWARSEDLAVLQRLIRLSDKQALTVVSAYRNDETPNLPVTLAGVRQMTLKRLDFEAMSELASSMLGPAGNRAQVLELLDHETEGNAYFIVEVVRSLAEYAGDLEQIGTRTLPENVFAGGIENLIHYKLARLTGDTRALLELAAVLGRRLDLNLLEKAVQPGSSLEEWLQTCNALAVLEVQDDYWRFVHDKLREGLLREMSDEDRIALHEKAATLIERAYPEDPRFTLELAYHYGMASDVKNEVRYSIIAGEQLMASMSYTEAEQYLHRATQIADEAELLLLEKARIEYRLGIINRVARESYAYFHRALKSLDQPIPTNVGLTRYLRMSGELFRQLILHRRLPQRLIQQPEHRRPALVLAADIYQALAEAYWNDQVATRHYFEAAYAICRGMNLAEAAGKPTRGLARTYGNAALGLAKILGVYHLGHYYGGLAKQVADQVADAETLSYVYNLTGHVAMDRALWTEAERDLKYAIEQAEKVRNPIRRFIALTNLVELYRIQGKFADAMGCADKMLEPASHSDHNRYTDLVPLMFKATLLAVTWDSEQLSQAQTALLDALQNKESIRAQANYVIRGWCALAEIAIRQKQLKKAIMYLKKAIAHADETKSPTDRLVAPIVDYLATDPDDADKPYLKDHVIQGFHSLTRQSRNILHFRGKLCLYEGLYAWLEGQQAKAFEAWHRGLKLTREHGLLYHEARIAFQLGTHIEQNIPQRKVHLEYARDLFRRMGAYFDVSLAEAQLVEV